MDGVKKGQGSEREALPYPFFARPAICAFDQRGERAARAPAKEQARPRSGGAYRFRSKALRDGRKERGRDQSAKCSPTPFLPGQPFVPLARGGCGRQEPPQKQPNGLATPLSPQRGGGMPGEPGPQAGMEPGRRGPGDWGGVAEGADSPPAFGQARRINTRESYYDKSGSWPQRAKVLFTHNSACIYFAALTFWHDQPACKDGKPKKAGSSKTGAAGKARPPRRGANPDRREGGGIVPRRGVKRIPRGRAP